MIFANFNVRCIHHVLIQPVPTLEEYFTLLLQCHYAQTILHIRHLLSTEMKSTLARSLILTKLDYYNSLLHGSHTAVSRHYSACRTTLPGMFFFPSTGPVSRKPAAAPDPLGVGSSQNQLQAGCDDLQDPDSTGLPAYLSYHINPRESTRSSETSLLTVPFTRSEFAKCAFRCSAPSGNSVPSFISNSGSLTTFESRRLKTCFFRLSFERSGHV